MGMLEECISYLDGTIYNVKSKITSFEDTLTGPGCGGIMEIPQSPSL
jgi:hypothetical protein